MNGASGAGEAAAPLGIENRAERARGVKIWEAQPVERPVAGDQSHRAPVANRRVVAKRDVAGVAHRPSVVWRARLLRSLRHHETPGARRPTVSIRARASTSPRGSDPGNCLTIPLESVSAISMMWRSIASYSRMPARWWPVSGSTASLGVWSRCFFNIARTDALGELHGFAVLRHSGIWVVL